MGSRGARSKPDQVGVEGGGKMDQRMKKAAILRLICVEALLREEGTPQTLGPGSMSDVFPLLPSLLVCLYASLVILLQTFSLKSFMKEQTV